MRVSVVGAMILAAGIAIPAIAYQDSPSPTPSPSVHPKGKRKAAPATSPRPTRQPSSASANEEQTARTLGIVIGAIVAFALYWLPSFVAVARHHHNGTAIIVTNFLLGWTVVGWIGTLIWACTTPPPAATGRAAGQ